MVLKAVQFVAVVLTGWAAVPGVAHVAVLPNKIGLGRDDYFVVQGIYRGWALFGVVFFAALGANIAAAWLVRRRRGAAWLSLAAAVGVALSLVVFFTWVEPANRATQYWTVAPPAWEALRTQWEAGHAAGAALMAAAFCCAVLSALLTRDGASDA